MGVFTVSVDIAKPTTRPSFHRVKRIMVDTGSEMTWVANEILRKAGITVRKKDQPFVMANGQPITRNVGYAIIRCGEFETIDEVVFAENGDLQLLGARTLERFNVIADPRKKLPGSCWANVSSVKGVTRCTRKAHARLQSIDRTQVNKTSHFRSPRHRTAHSS